MNVLIDTSVWIDYFKFQAETNELDYLIDNNLIFTNDLILTELIPFFRLKRQTSVIETFSEVAKLPLLIDWQEIQEYQYNCLQSGVNSVGTPDLIIAQNALQNDSFIFTLDKHFSLMQDVLNLKLYI
ncbi:MAG: PIN domain-containing protein [SAR324 cluster bacterium]|nr:PIN domain-containing protein [SAR324 cluster bacterium]